MDFSQLKSFNPAIVYCLEPQSYAPAVGVPQISAQFRQKDPKGDFALANFFHVVGQIADLQTAYFYFEEVLQVIRMKQAINSGIPSGGTIPAESTEEIPPTACYNGFALITPCEILAWHDGFHRRAGKTLLAERGDKSGEITQSQVFRWEHGMEIQNQFTVYLTGMFLAHSEAEEKEKEKKRDEKEGKEESIGKKKREEEESIGKKKREEEENGKEKGEEENGKEKGEEENVKKKEKEKNAGKEKGEKEKWRRVSERGMKR